MNCVLSLSYPEKNLNKIIVNPLFCLSLTKNFAKRGLPIVVRLYCETFSATAGTGGVWVFEVKPLSI